MIFKAKISQHFTLDEMITASKHPDNIPSMQTVCNLTYGVATILEPARLKVGCAIVVTSGYRNSVLNSQVGGVTNSQHLTGCAADITCPVDKMPTLIEILRNNTHVDQLLTAKTWLHVSWNPQGKPRHDIRLNYYK